MIDCPVDGRPGGRFGLVTLIQIPSDTTNGLVVARAVALVLRSASRLAARFLRSVRFFLFCGRGRKIAFPYLPFNHSDLSAWW